MQDHIRRAIESSVMLKPLYELIGYKAVMSLIQRWGGSRIYVPMTFNSEEHPIIQSIGLEAAEKLSWKHGGEQLSLPTNMIIANAARDHEILRMRREGKSVAAMAKKFRLSERRVRVILAENKNACRDNPVPVIRLPKKAARRTFRHAGQLELFPKVNS